MAFNYAKAGKITIRKCCRQWASAVVAAAAEATAVVAAAAAEATAAAAAAAEATAAAAAVAQER